MARELIADRMVGVDAAVGPVLTKIVHRVVNEPDLEDRCNLLASLLLALSLIATTVAHVSGDSAAEPDGGTLKLRAVLHHLESRGMTL